MIIDNQNCRFRIDFPIDWLLSDEQKRQVLGIRRKMNKSQYRGAEELNNLFFCCSQLDLNNV
jgi:hypothetical protein